MTDDNGNIVVNPSTGLPVASDQMAIVGTMNYKYQMGVSTMLQYKGITLGVDFDIRQGGKMYSRTKAINYLQVMLSRLPITTVTRSSCLTRLIN